MDNLRIASVYRRRKYSLYQQLVSYADIETQGKQFLLEPLIPPFDLIDVVDDGSPLRTDPRDYQSHAGTDIGRRDMGANQLAWA